MGKEKRCFVISPIGQPESEVREHADAVLDYIIRPALVKIEKKENYKIEAIRSDEIGTPGKIEDQMLEAILTFDMCIAILTDNNPNVFYELAIAQAAGKRVVLMCEEGAQLPFDLKDYRTIYYDLKPKSIKEDSWVPVVMEQTLEVLKPDYEPPSLLEGFDQIIEEPKSYLLNALSKEFGGAPEFNGVVRETQKTCDLMGICLLSWKRQASIEVLDELGKRKVVTRILTMHQDNSALEHMINDNLTESSLETTRQIAGEMEIFFKDLAQKYPSFEARTIKKGLSYNQLIITDTTALILQYMFSRNTGESPLLKIPRETELCKVFSGEFENLWELNEPAKKEKQITQNSQNKAKRISPKRSKNNQSEHTRAKQ